MSTLTLADGAGVTHKAVIQQVRKHAADLNQFGSLAFEMRVMREDGRGGEATEFARLNARRMSAGRKPTRFTSLNAGPNV